MLDQLGTSRTFALVGHGGCGKTSVAEMLLFCAGATKRLGKIEEGNTALDYEPEEIKRRGSIQPGFASYLHNKSRHFLVDTPGDNNFSGDLANLLTAVDAVIFVLDAIDGVKPLTKKIWGEVAKQGLPAIFFINKMDRERADFEMAVSGISARLGIKPFVQYLPLGAADTFKGAVDILADKAFEFTENGGQKVIPIPDYLLEQVESLREMAVEEVAVSDEDLMERYLSDGELSSELMLPALRKAVCSAQIFPVCLGSALKGMGGQLLLNAIAEYFPSALDAKTKEITGQDGSTRPVSAEAPFTGFVFKTLFDPFAGQLSFLRVLSGTLTPDATLNNPGKGLKERAGQLLLPLGKETQVSKEPLGPGAILALAKLKDTATGDTLCDEKSNFQFPKPALPATMISYALAAAEKGEEDKVFTAISKLLDEDVTLQLSRDDETGDMLLSGMGQSHIETAIEKVKRRYKVNVLLKAPKIPYRETIKGKAEVQGRHKKQTGGRGQFGDCWIRVEPRGRGEGYEFVDAIVGGSIPRNYIPAVDKGVQEAAARGVVSGNPVVDFRCTVFDGSFHTVDSSEMAFKIAGGIAFKKACEKLKIVLLEPIVLVSVSTPDEFMGDVIGDLSSRRGKVLGSDSGAGVTEIQAHVPMAEMQEYAKTLSSMTGGQGAFTMAFDRYEECPPPIAEKVIAEAAKAQE